MDRTRVIALTLALILCASAGWARGLGVLGLGGGAVVPVAAVTILDDTLYEASVVALTSHTPAPGPGGSWSYASSGSAVVESTGAHPDSAGVIQARNSVSTSLMSPFSVRTTGTAPAGVGFGAGVYKASSQDGYFAWVDGSGAVGFYKLVSGTFTQIGSNVQASPWNSTLEYTVKLYHSGGAWGVELREGTTVVASATGISDSTHNVADLVYPGFPSSGGGVRVTNIEATND